MSNQRKWFAQATNGHRYGPHDISFFASWAKQGSITPSSLVWTEGQPDWLPADQTELRSIFTEVKLPPPLPHERRHDLNSPPAKQATLTAAPGAEAGQAPSDGRRWFIITPAGHHQGPMKREHLHWSITNGNLRRDTLVRAIGQDEWTPAERTELNSLFDEVRRNLPNSTSDVPIPRGMLTADKSDQESDKAGKPPEVLAYLVVVLVIGAMVLGFSSSFSWVFGCNVTADQMDLTAESRGMSLPGSVDQRLTTMKYEALALQARGDNRGACRVLKEAKDMLAPYRE